MRRMISQKLQDLLKKLSKSIWADDRGNLEVGKNLKVDGNMKVNGNIEDADGDRYVTTGFTKELTQHHIRLTSPSAAERKIYVTLDIWNNDSNKIDSLSGLASALYSDSKGRATASGSYIDGDGNVFQVIEVTASGELGSDVGVVYIKNGTATGSIITSLQVNCNVIDAPMNKGDVL